MLSHWFRALVYMCIIGVGWFIVLPACLLYWQFGRVALDLRGWPFVAIGVVLFTMGVGIALWAGYYLIRHGDGTPFPLDPPRRLVTNGPYRFVRNPQAIAMVLMTAGETLTIRSSLLWLMLPLTIIYLEALVGPLEARQLASDFGSEYQAYVAQVAKWLPRRQPRSPDLRENPGCRADIAK
jgi:protein-S-isoprenylcysteine O-methyltransferase Ste14